MAKTLTIPNPAAGSDASVVFPETGCPIELQSVMFTRANSAAVATRQVSITYTERNGVAVARWIPGVTQIATQTFSYSAIRGGARGVVSNGSLVSFELGLLELNSGGTLAIGAVDGDAGDQLSSISVTYKDVHM
jgi:hypothetical protein